MLGWLQLLVNARLVKKLALYALTEQTTAQSVISMHSEDWMDNASLIALLDIPESM